MSELMSPEGKIQLSQLWHLGKFVNRNGILFFNKIILVLYVYEPFGLGRFATDHSLTKAASRPLFARVRRYAPQESRWNQVNPTIFEICLLFENNNNKYLNEKFLNAKFGISILV